MKNSDFAHLHVHSEYSMLDGLGTPDAYAKKAAELGFKYLGLTDHGCINGLIEFQKSCDKYDIKPILGCEAYIVPDATIKKDRAIGHICLLVKNKIGFSNLCSLLTYANIEGFYYKPRIDYEQLLSHCQGLVITTACANSFLKLPKGEDFFYKLIDEIGEDLFLEIMPHKIKEQIAMNKLVMHLSRETKCKIIATNDCHYVNKNEHEAQEVLLAIQTKASWNNPKRWRFSVEGLHLRSAREMIRAFDRIGISIKKYLCNTIEVAEKCSGFKIPKKDVLLPRVKGVSLKEGNFLWDLCAKGFKKKFNKNIKSDKVYYTRLKEEYDLVIKKKFTRYFLIVWELVCWCKKNNIIVGEGRGSAGGSLISFLLNITGSNLDPIRHDLLFSRFIAKDREGFPDIDIDFEDSKRHIVKQHLEAIYGYNHVANVSSFNRMKARAVIKDISRVFDIPLKEVNGFTKLIEDNDDHTGIQEAIDTYQEGKDFDKNHPKIIKIAKVLEGQIRGYGSHAAALIVSRDPLTQSNRCNLIRRKVAGEDTTLINWEKNNAEYVGLMKLDALGLKLLSIFAEAIRLIKENYDKDIHLDEIDINDKAVLKEINAGHTAGLFQLNTYAMTTLIEEMGIERFKDLSDALALVRPGPSKSGMTAQYIERKQGRQWGHLHKAYEKITKNTYGVVVYQEQVMEVINKLAGLPYTTADKIRKIIGKKRDKKEFAPYKKKFIQGCLKQKTLSAKEAEEFWTALQEHSKYSFNKAHSTAYAILGIQSAWLKKYYPTEFICGSLTYGSKTKKPVLIEEAYRLGLTLVLPKVGTSDAEKWIARGNKLYIPFKEVKDIGAVKAKQAAVMTTIEYNKSLKDLFYIKNENVQVKHKGSLGKLLEKIGAYELNDDVQLSEEIQAYFDFRIITNPKDTYKNLYGFFGGMIRLDRIDSILNGDLQEINGLDKKKKIINRVKFHGHEDLSSCTSCSLREECSAPVHPSKGKYNIAIIGEAPGPTEDEEGKGFVGSSGNLIWKPIRKRGYKRKDFHITNIIKCYPKQSRTPTDKQANICAKFIRKELYEIQPKIILAFGNTCLNFFTRKKSGITNMSGKIIWNEEYSSWIVWCIHPAATLYDNNAKLVFKRGMKSFFRLLRILMPLKQEIK